VRPRSYEPVSLARPLFMAVDRFLIWTMLAGRGFSRLSGDLVT
jgi:hypothetical protein